MNDEHIINSLSTELDIQLNKIDSYLWNKVGYVINSEGRVEVLNLHSQNIRKLPEYIKELSELKVLHVVGNKLRSIQEASCLKNLEILAVQANEISSISALKGLNSLKALYLSHNPIVDLNPLVGIDSLKILSIQNEKTVDCTPIGSLINLEEIVIGQNEVKNPFFLLNCNKLSELLISGRSGKAELPEQIYDYIQSLNLVKLDISFFNSIRFERIVELSQLKSLGVTLCNLSNIQKVFKIEQLEKLDLAYNKVKSIQELSELIYLQKLDISENPVKDISPIKNLHLLKSINLRKTAITDLTPLLGFKMNFVYDENNKNEQLSPHENEILISKCNNIVTPPIEIVKQGNQAIQRYFKKIDEEGADYIFEAKLILVGEGNAGKTSLQRRLVDKNASLPKGNSRTRGIDVVDFEIEPNKNSIRKIIHIWDFGGQDVYYPVHRFFITENSVFVLLASSRQTHHNFDYWIPTIFQFGGKSPIIIGQTCHEGNKISWNDLSVYLSSPYFNIVKTQALPYYELNLLNKNQGLQEIKKTIIGQVTNLPHYGKGVPKSWVLLRKILLVEATKIACISFDKFKGMCRNSDRESFSSLNDIKDCCQFLHDIGVVLWYSNHEELSNWVVLQPEWAMNAVYKIIDDEEIQNRRGNILAKDFNRLWAHTSFEERHFILKKMLEVFKIAFPKKHKKEDYIIPARLLSIPDQNKWKETELYLRIEYEYEFMPRGLVNQLSAELSRYIVSEKEVWNNAVNFSYINSDALCQVTEEFYNRKIIIKAKGNDARGIIMLVMDALNNIMEDYKGVKTEIYVPCICSVCRNLSIPTTFLYNKLVEWSIRRKTEVFCNESGESLSIQELLYNVGLSKNETERKNMPVRKTFTIFLASSSELKEDREQFEIFINRENKQLNDKGIFLRLELWEDFIDAMSTTRLQNEYNKIVKECDIFVSLFFTKVGKFTKEEFETAFGEFREHGKPLIYTYFKSGQIDIDQINEADIQSKVQFENKLKELGHFKTSYKNIDDLKYQFKKQLEKVLSNL
uniref:COR domain-containing protein n=1 Tax=Roseihalotalea indica TaxID=2867963 RepID=A0AA49JII0_9BACT|nr:COR domain-containing protein [Tunicatimonas sp. TK19036]